MAGVEITQVGTRVNEKGDLVVLFSIVLTSEPDSYVAVAITGGDDTEAAFSGTSVFPPNLDLNVVPFAEEINTELADAGIATSFDTATLEATPANVAVFAPRIEGIDTVIYESNFATPVIIEVTGLDDLVADGDQLVTFTPVVITGTPGIPGWGGDVGIAPSLDAESYASLPASAITDETGTQVTTLTVINTDNEGFAIDVGAVTGALDEADQSQTGSYTITLGHPPSEAVGITIDGGTSVEISTDGGTTFGSTAIAVFGIGEIAADVILRAADDTEDQGGPYNANITHSVTTPTSEYPADSVIPDVEIGVLDNEMPFVTLGAVINVAEGTTVATGSVEVLLDRPAPTGGLIVPYTVTGSATADSDYASLSGTVSFAEGETTASIELSPIADQRDEGAFEDVIITLDENFTEYRVGETGSAAIQIWDNDTAGVTISDTDLSFNEDGMASYTVVLTSDPGVNPVLGENLVSIRIDGANLLDPPLELGGDVSTSATLGSRLFFTTDNWFTPQTVTVERSRDGAVTGDQNFTLVNTVIASGEYNTVTSDNVSVEVVDVDMPAGFLVTPGGEGLTGFDNYGYNVSSSSFNIALTSVPLTDVLVRVTHDFVPGVTENGFNEPDINIEPNILGRFNETLLIFTPGETDIDVTIERLVGASFNSPVDLGDVDVNLSFEVLSESDAQYAGLTIDPITVTVVPKFEADLEFTPVNGTDLSSVFELTEGQTFEEGFRIEQSTFPLGDVAFRVSVSDGIEFDALATGLSNPLIADDVTTFDFGVINRATDGYEFRFSASDDNIDRSTDVGARTFDGQITIEVLGATNAPEYEDLTFEPFNVTLTENDLAGITAVETDGDSVAIPGGRADVLRIDFDSQPVAPVTISVTTNEDIESVADITVQPEDWASAVEIPLAAVLDSDNTDETVNVSYVLSSADPKFDGLGGNIDVFIPDLLDNAALADGLDTALGELQAITNAALDFDLLFVDTSTALPDMFGIFKDDLVAAIEGESSEDPETLVGLIEATIEGSFDGIALLQDTEATVEIGLDPSAISFDVVLEFDDSFETGISADFGIPALGFDLDGSLISDFGYSLGFGFGIDRDNGFFLNSETTSLEAGADISLSSDFEASGSIGIVGLTAANNEDNPTSANIDFSFGIADPDDDGKLTLAEIRNTDTADLFDTTFNAGANAALDFETSFAANTTQFPSFLFTLESEWDALSFEDGALNFGSAPTVAFNDIGINIGSFLNRFAEPILDRVDSYIDPFRPVLDALQTDIPILSEFGVNAIEGHSIQDDEGNTTIVSILEAVQNVQAFQEFGFDIRISGFINAIDDVQQFIADTSAASTLAREEGGGLVLNLGSYEIDLDTNTFDAEVGTSEFETAKTGIQESTAGGEANVDPTERIAKTTSNMQLQGKLFDLTNAFGFPSERIAFPVIQDVENIFGLLTGSTTDVSLFEVNFPTFALKGGFEVPIPIFAFLGAPQPTLDIGGSIGIEATFGLGYDTQGFFTWADEFDFAADQAFRILDGLYLTDTRDGEDIDEITLTAGVQGSLGIKGVARGTGGLEGEIGLDFNDVGEAYGESDGKVRVISEIAERLLDDPTKIFNFSGVLSAFVEGYLIGAGTERESIELVRVEVENGEFSISTAFDGPINGANVYFDSNFNGVQDDFEPWTLTGADAGNGSYELAINLNTFDVNGNGVIDPSEGRIVVEGGIDLDTTQFQQVSYTSQSGWSVVSPLTMLATELGGVNPDETQQALRTAFGLPEGFIFAADDPLEGVLAGTPAGVEAFKLRAQVDNLIILGANTLGDALEVTAEELFDNVYAERENDTRETGAVAIIAELGIKVAAGETIDLTDQSTIRSIIQAAAIAVGVTPEGLDVAIADIGTRNDVIAAVTETGETARAEIVAQVGLDDVDVSYDFIRNNLFFRLVVASREAPDVADSIAKVTAAFDLPTGVDLTSFNAIDAIESGSLDGLTVYAAGNQINATLVALNSVTGNPVGDLAALLNVIDTASGVVDLSNAGTIAELIGSSDPDLTDEVVEALAAEIATINADIQEVVNNANPDDNLNTLRSAIAGIQSFVQDTKIDIFTDVATGVTPVSELPVLIDEAEATFGAGFSVSTNEDEIVTGNLVDEIEDAIAAELTIASVEGQTTNVGQAVVLASGAIVMIDVDGNISYDPNGAFNDLNDGEEAYERIAYSVQPQGDLPPVNMNVTVRINGSGMANVPPEAMNDFAETSENATVIIDVLNNDSDPDGSALTVVDLNLSSTLGVVTELADGRFDYDPAGAFDALEDGETAVDSFTYTIADENGATATATALVSVTGVSDVGPVLTVGIWDTQTDTLIRTLEDGDVITLSELGRAPLTIAAFVPEDSPIFNQEESARLSFNDGEFTKLENFEPYSLFGDFFGNFAGIRDLIDVGQNTISFDVFDRNFGRGDLIAEVDFEFTAIDDQPPLEIALFDARSDTFLRVIEDGDTVLASELNGAKRLTLAATVRDDGALAGMDESVEFEFNDIYSRVENFEPYALFGDRSGNLRGRRDLLEEGENSLEVTVYSENRARGEVLGEFDIDFIFVDDFNFV